MAARTSQLYGIDVIEGTPKARPSQLYELDVIEGTPKARVSQLWEVIVVDYTPIPASYNIFTSPVFGKTLGSN